MNWSRTMHCRAAFIHNTPGWEGIEPPLLRSLPSLVAYFNALLLLPLLTVVRRATSREGVQREEDVLTPLRATGRVQPLHSVPTIYCRS